MSTRTKPLDAFEVVEPLGEGAMGRAWRVRHLRTGQHFAIKTIRGAPEAGRAQFLREARALARMAHDHIVRIVDFGQLDGRHEVFGDHPLYIVMELGDAGTFEPGAVQSWTEFTSFAHQVLDALAHAHSRDLVHLDLKPDNILRTNTGRILLADLGISRLLDKAESREGVSGTPAYMAPEQGLGLDWQFGPWTDLYALGCLSWETLTGTIPFDAPSLVGLISAHVNTPLPRFLPRFDVPPGTEAWLRRLLAKAPADRFCDAAQTTFALAKLGAAGAVTPTEARTDEGAAAPTVRMAPDAIATTLALIDACEVTNYEFARSSDELMARETPPFPPDWRSAASPRPLRLGDVGLGLFDLRPSPFVGREPQQDALWSIFGDLLAPRSTQVVIRGPSGVGKTRLVDAFCSRLRELGQAAVLRFEVNERTWSDAVATGVLDFLRGHGLSDADLDTQVGLRMREVDPSLVHRLVGRGDGFDDRLEISSALVDVLAAYSSTYPLVVVADDVTTDVAPFELADLFMRRYPTHRVLFVSTVAETASAIVTGRAADVAHAIDLAPLTSANIRTLVEGTAPLAPAEVDRLLSATGPDAVFVRQVIARWLETDAMRADDDGYHGGELPPPPDELWIARTSDVVRPLGDVEETLLGLGAIAAIGQRAARPIWERVCADLGIRRDEACIEALSRKGFLRSGAEMLELVEPGFRRALLSHLHARGESKRLLLTTARVLQQEVALPAIRRAAECLIEVGRIEEAIALVRHVCAHSGTADSIAMNHWQDVLLAKHDDDPATSQLRFLIKMDLALDHVQNCDFGATATLVAEMEAMLAEQPSRRLRSELDYVEGFTALFRNEPERGFKSARASLEACQIEQRPLDVMHCTTLLGQLSLYSRAFEDARAYYETSSELAQASTPYQQGWARFRIGMVNIFTGDLDVARAALDDAMQRFQANDDRFGTMYARENLGYLAQERGAYDDAEVFFRGALTEARFAGYKGAVTMHERLGRLYARTGRPDDALTHLGEVRAEAERAGFDMLVWYYFDAEAEALGTQGRWADVEAVIAEARRTLARPGLYADSIAATWDRVANLARRASREALAHDTQELAGQIRSAPMQAPGERAG